MVLVYDRGWYPCQYDTDRYIHTVYRGTGVLVYGRGWYPCQYDTDRYIHAVYKGTGVLVYDRGWYPCQYDTDSIYILYIGVQGYQYMIEDGTPVNMTLACRYTHSYLQY